MVDPGADHDDVEPWSPDDESVPMPRLAVVAIVLAALTLLIGIGFAVYAGVAVD